jgi:hypothetical protein
VAGGADAEIRMAPKEAGQLLQLAAVQEDPHHLYPTQTLSDSSSKNTSIALRAGAPSVTERQS